MTKSNSHSLRFRDVNIPHPLSLVFTMFTIHFRPCCTTWDIISESAIPIRRPEKHRPYFDIPPRIHKSHYTQKSGSGVRRSVGPYRCIQNLSCRDICFVSSHINMSSTLDHNDPRSRSPVKISYLVLAHLLRATSCLCSETPTEG